MRILALLFLLMSCATKQTSQIEEMTIVDTVVIEVSHHNLGMFCFPSRVDTIVDEYKIYLEKFN